VGYELGRTGTSTRNHHRREFWTLLADLQAAIKDSADSFNRLYRPDRQEQIQINATQNRIALSLLLPRTQHVQSETLKRAEALIAYDSGSNVISATFKESGAHPVSLVLDSENGEVFWRARDGVRVSDADSASRILLEEFLMKTRKR
jgi:hypothetical protein